jgi:glycosyltransferase involved in cell wall biosynthesis
MNTPLISVCIAAYNAEKYLEATLRTVLSQNFKDWELIVTEDGSKDRTEAYVRDFSSTVPQNVIYNRHDTNRGLSATRNTGIASAESEWIAFLDADDLWKADHLDNLISTSQIEDCDAVYAGSVLHDDNTWDRIGVRAPNAADLADLPVALYSGHLSIMPSSVMIKRESLRKFGPISNEFNICSDTEYWMRLLSLGGRMCYTGTNTCIYRQHSGTLSQKTVAALIESARLCERYSNWKAIPQSLARSRQADLYRWAGHTLLKEKPAAALESLSRSLRLQPFNYKTFGLWVKAFLRRKTPGTNAA